MNTLLCVIRMNFIRKLSLKFCEILRIFWRLKLFSVSSYIILEFILSLKLFFSLIQVDWIQTWYNRFSTFQTCRLFSCRLRALPHREEMIPPPLLHCTVLYYTLLYIGVSRVAINIFIKYGSRQVTYCHSYIFCHKTITCGQILEFELSIEPYWGVIFYTGI